MTIEHTEIRIDSQKGISVTSSPIGDGYEVRLKRVDFGADRSFYKAMRVESPNRVGLLIQGEEGEEELYLGGVIREGINVLGLQTEEKYEAESPLRDVRIIHLYTWSPNRDKK